MAIALRKTILPLQCLEPVCGFVSDYHAIHAADLGTCLWDLIRGILSRHPEERASLRRRFVSALCNSTTFHAARSSLLVLQHNFFPLTQKEKVKILEVLKKNDQIGGFKEVTLFISKLEKELEKARSV